jgi:phosphatidylserine/phosphatidylglycerophosphate/cardiolipin synthase-like enzyme
LQVRVHFWDARDWFFGGIMHMKILIADGQTAYLGSANMDWLSLW